MKSLKFGNNIVTSCNKSHYQSIGGSRPSSRPASRPASRPNSRPASRQGSKPPSRYGSTQSLDGLFANNFYLWYCLFFISWIITNYLLCLILRADDSCTPSRIPRRTAVGGSGTTPTSSRHNSISGRKLTTPVNGSSSRPRTPTGLISPASGVPSRFVALWCISVLRRNTFKRNQQTNSH